jgi:aspartate carbamoyltransferase catalytic subunit
MALKISHLLGIESMDRDQIEMILDTAESFKEISTRSIKKVPTLRGKTVVNLFFEPSTRTRSSFEIAEKRLSADSLNFSASTSAVLKGETLLDTVRNLEAMNPDVFVIRHACAGAAGMITKVTGASVINAGDGAHEHPTQALLDAFTIREHKKKIDGLRVAIIGDIAHSRVVRSNIFLLNKLGASVILCGPSTLLPPHAAVLGVETTTSIEQALDGADVVMMLRVQLERMKLSLFPSAREYFRLFALTPERVGLARDDVIIMHPGPINRGVEIASEVADGPYSVILEQVTNGVAVRMAVLYLLIGGGEEQDEAAN